jgi:hypothetical protein
MSELIHVSNLTDFQELSTACRKPVENPAPLGASHIMRRGTGAGLIPPQALN